MILLLKSFSYRLFFLGLGHLSFPRRSYNISANFTPPPSHFLTFSVLSELTCLYVLCALHVMYDVWLCAPTYVCVSTNNTALSFHNILVFTFHAYRTRQMSVNGWTKTIYYGMCIVTKCIIAIVHSTFCYKKNVLLSLLLDTWGVVSLVMIFNWAD